MMNYVNNHSSTVETITLQKPGEVLRYVGIRRKVN